MLPRGIWFEAKHKRYRVRLYKNRQVEHLSYHTSKEEALKTFELLHAPAEGDLLQRLVAQARLYYKGTRRSFA